MSYVKVADTIVDLAESGNSLKKQIPAHSFENPSSRIGAAGTVRNKTVPVNRREKYGRDRRSSHNSPYNAFHTLKCPPCDYSDQ
jgi:hypothetical protein